MNRTDRIMTLATLCACLMANGAMADEKARCDWYPYVGVCADTCSQVNPDTEDGSGEAIIKANKKSTIQAAAATPAAAEVNCDFTPYVSERCAN